jgi:hypothetical protein
LGAIGEEKKQGRQGEHPDGVKSKKIKKTYQQFVVFRVL